MAWQIRFKENLNKKLKHIDKTALKTIFSALKELETIENPRTKGKALQGNLKKYWRYRVGDYRIICDIQDKEIVILVIDIGHRKDIYQ